MITYLWVLSQVQGDKVDTWKAAAKIKIMQGKDLFGLVDNLFKSLIQNFGVINLALKAHEEIRKLWQEKETAKEYYRKFHALAKKTGYDEEYLLMQFKSSLNEALYNEIWRLRSSPVSLNGWYQEVVQIDWQWRYQQSEHHMLFGNQGASASKADMHLNYSQPKLAMQSQPQ